MITCDETINAEAKSYNKANFNEKNAICKTKNFYILFAFLLITISLLIVISIYFYYIKTKTLVTALHNKWQLIDCIANMDELKEIDIKNRTCYHFDDKIKIENFNLDNILID